MEAESVEDSGVEFCQFVYNVQPGITIDYATGDSHETADTGSETETQTYVLNTNTKKFHKPDCPSVKSTKAENKKTWTGTRSELIAEGYEPCSRCKP